VKLTRTRIAAAALVSTALVSAAAIIPSYAQDAGAPAATAPAAAPADTIIRVRIGGPGFGGPLGRDVGGLAQDLLATYDTDGNGTVTQAEIDAVRAAEIATYDANGDGTLNLEEYQALWLARVYERMVDAFQELDANGDGTVTAEEFNAGLNNIVALRDADGDGALGPTDRPQPTIERHVAPGGFGGPGNAGPGGFGGGPRR
jgi:hypothetical protein